MTSANVRANVKQRETKKTGILYFFYEKMRNKNNWHFIIF